MDIAIKKDGDGYLAVVVGKEQYLYAFWYTEQEAESELYNVVDMTMDIHLEQLEGERKLKSFLRSRISSEAIEI
jgi:predicted RNase H-like HicB family nuclease